MPMSLEELFTEAQVLPVEAKAILAERLIASIEADIDPRILEKQLAEVRRRVDEIRSGKVKSMEGVEALARVRAEIGL